MKRNLAFIIILFISGAAGAQTNFSGSWGEPQLEMISGIQYSNAVPNQVTVFQTKDSIRITRLENEENAKSYTITLALNGKAFSYIGTNSKRTINFTANLSNNGNTLTITSTFSFSDKPGEVEYKNIEVWEYSGRTLTITKVSDATLTDDWTIKAIYTRQ
jgi:hypothetical protein